MTLKQRIKEWLAVLTTPPSSLANDAEYWTLCRTYGDDSREVYNYLRCRMQERGLEKK